MTVISYSKIWKSYNSSVLMNRPSKTIHRRLVQASTNSCFAMAMWNDWRVAAEHHNAICSMYQLQVPYLEAAVKQHRALMRIQNPVYWIFEQWTSLSLSECSQLSRCGIHLTHTSCQPSKRAARCEKLQLWSHWREPARAAVGANEHPNSWTQPLFISNSQGLSHNHGTLATHPCPMG